MNVSKVNQINFSIKI